MELLQLEYFYAVAKTQHVTHTAEQLHIAQPALTQSIHRLEKELGVPLFHRNGRNIALTEYGVYLRDALKPILENANIFGVNLYDAGLADKVEALFVEEIAGAGAVRATLKKYLA